MNIFKMKKLITITVAAALAVPVFAQGALKQDYPERHGMNPEKLAQVDRVINEAITAKEIPGAVLSVVRGNDIVYLKAYGNKSVVPTVVASGGADDDRNALRPRLRQQMRGHDARLHAVDRERVRTTHRQCGQVYS